MKRVISEITVADDEIHLVVRQVSSPLTSPEEFERRSRDVKRTAKDLIERLMTFVEGTNHQCEAYYPVLNAVGDKLVFRSHANITPVCDPFDPAPSAGFTAPGTWRKVRSVIRGFDSKIVIIKK